MSLEIPPGISSQSAACSRQATWVRVRPRSRWCLDHTLTTAAWSSAFTSRRPGARSAAMATDRASLGVVLVRRPGRQQPHPGAQLGPHIEHPLARRDQLLGQPSPRAPSTAQVRSGIPPPTPPAARPGTPRRAPAARPAARRPRRSPPAGWEPCAGRLGSSLLPSTALSSSCLLWVAAGVGRPWLIGGADGYGGGVLRRRRSARWACAGAFADAVLHSLGVMLAPCSPTSASLRSAPCRYRRPRRWRACPPAARHPARLAVHHRRTCRFAPRAWGFFRLRLLGPGDHMYVGGRRAPSRCSGVNAVRVYPQDRSPTAGIDGPTPDAELCLITCGGSFDQRIGSHLSNVVVYAVAVS